MSKDLPTVMLTEAPASNYSSNTFRPVKVMMMVRMIMMVMMMMIVMVMVMVPPASDYSSFAFRSMKAKLISRRVMMMVVMIYGDDGGNDDIYIMMQCLSVCHEK